MNIFENYYKKVLENIDKKKRISPLRVIRAFCLECVGFSGEEVSNCSANQDNKTKCPLFAFRFGKNKSGLRTGEAFV